MKKVLFGTTALLAAGMIASAANAAEEISLKVGGYMDWYVSSSSQDSDFEKANSANYNSLDVQGDGEIHFMGDTTLDNGVKVAVTVELEGGNADENDPIDTSFVTVDTAYGRVALGSMPAVTDDMVVGAPDVGRLGVQATNLTNIIVVPAAVDRLDSTSLNSDGDAQKISYITPTYYGVTLGASYIPGADNTNMDGEDTSLTQTAFEEGHAYALMFSQDVMGVGVTASAAYANYNTGAKERRDEAHGGLELSYMGFTLAGAYRNVSATSVYTNASYATGLGSDAQDGYAWDLGASYEAGPYGVSLSYMKSSVEGATGTLNNTAEAVDNKDEVEMYLLSGKYNMGAGVDTFASFGYIDAENESLTEDKANSNEGWAFVTGLALAF